MNLETARQRIDSAITQYGAQAGAVGAAGRFEVMDTEHGQPLAINDQL